MSANMKIVSIVALILSVCALGVSFFSGRQNVQKPLIDRVLEAGVLRLGYIVYPPLIYKDAATGNLSGISYEIVERVAQKLNIKTEWVEEVTWATAIEGLKAGRYDMVGTQMWPNTARAREAAFSIPSFYSVIYPYVKTGSPWQSVDMAKLNTPDVTISALEGEMSQFISQEDYPQAKVLMLPQLSSYSEIFLNIVNNKADITFVEPSTARDFLKTNPDSLVRVDSPPLRTFGNTFAFKRGERAMVDMWNVSLEELLNNGSIKDVLLKYDSQDDYTLPKQLI